MRKTFIDYLIETDTKDTYFLTADLGYNLLEPLERKMGKRFINIGIAEQSMISIASGLSLSGKRVFTYTMCPFYLRALEQIKLDLCYQDAKVVMIGSGTGFDYSELGTTHFALEDEEIMSCLSNLVVYTPLDVKDLKELIPDIESEEIPVYLRLSRGKENREINFFRGDFCMRK